MLLKKVSDTLASIKGYAPITELDEKIMHYYNCKTFCSEPTNILNSLPLSKMKDKKKRIFFHFNRNQNSTVFSVSRVIEDIVLVF